MALGSAQHPFQRQQLQMHGLYQPQQQQQRARSIAPAPYAKPAPPTSSAYAAGTTLESNNPSVIRRNARERNRVKQVNNGFLNLRQHLPQAIVADLSNGRRGIGPGANKNLSKVDTLRMAVEYIRRLQRVIDDVDSASDTSSVSSFHSFADSSSFSGSPPPPSQTHSQLQSQAQSLSLSRSFAPTGAAEAAVGGGSFYPQLTQSQPQQPYYPLSYAGSFQPQGESSATLVSPAASISSSAYSSDGGYYHSPTGPLPANGLQLKVEESFDEYPSTSADDEELLDYISLWQEDLCE